MDNVQESLKTDKQKLYEAHIIDENGKLKLYHPVTQSLIFKILEANGLEQAVKAYDKEMKKKAEKGA